MPDGESLVVSQALLKQISQAIRWTRNFQVSGADFSNSAEGASIRIPPRSSSVASGYFPRFAKITGNTRLGSPFQWSYTLRFLAEKLNPGYGGWTFAAGDDDRTGYNFLENMNGATGMTGAGVNISNLPAGFELQPAPTGAIVEIFPVGLDEDDPELWFVYANSVDGTCGGG